jgi:hypothetical protein
MGPGVYFTDDSDVAWNVARERAKKHNDDPVVIEARIHKNTPKGEHGIWVNVTTAGFTELVVTK